MKSRVWEQSGRKLLPIVMRWAGGSIRRMDEENLRVWEGIAV